MGRNLIVDATRSKNSSRMKDGIQNKKKKKKNQSKGSSNRSDNEEETEALIVPSSSADDAQEEVDEHKSGSESEDEEIEVEQEEEADEGEEEERTSSDVTNRQRNSEKKLKTYQKKKNNKRKDEKSENGLNRFPMHRINRIIKSESSDIRITQEAVFLINKASEKFLELFCKEAYACAFLDHKNYVGYNHLSSVVSKRRRFDFLSDFVPEKIKAEDASAEISSAET